MLTINALRSGLSTALTVALLATTAGIANAQSLPYSRDGVLIPPEQINSTDYPDAPNFWTGKPESPKPQTVQPTMPQMESHRQLPAEIRNLANVKPRGAVPETKIHRNQRTDSQSYLDLTRHPR
jgi:hypothetical protein